MSRLIKTIALILAAAGLLAPLASAQQQTVPQSEEVTFHDLNMATPQAGQTLLTRIQYAATRACGSHPSYNPVVSFNFSACRQKAIDDAVAQLQIPTLTAAYDVKFNPSATKMASR